MSSTPRLSLLPGFARQTRPSLRRVASASALDRTSRLGSQADTIPSEHTGLFRVPKLPRFFAHYLLVERIGTGGMGSVYRGVPLRGGAPVAVKILSEHLLGTEGPRRFRREIEALEQLAHPNVVRLLDHGWVEGQPYYVMELVEGPDLTRLVGEHGGLPPSRIVGILRDLAEGLLHAHEHGFVHRDIKPSNVILGWDEERGEIAKLLDFGLVLPGRGLGERLTAEDMLLGTPGYMAPEGAKSAHAVGPRADLYALAMIGFYLRTGRHLFRPVDVVSEESHATALERGWRALREAGGLPPPLEDALRSMLAFDARDRPVSARALLDVLDALDVPPWPREWARAWWRSYGAQAAATRSQLSAK
ncbi:MAG: serine/threonine-protein kinase [Sandaracinaceae bacterium]